MGRMDTERVSDRGLPGPGDSWGEIGKDWVDSSDFEGPKRRSRFVARTKKACRDVLLLDIYGIFRRGTWEEGGPRV